MKPITHIESRLAQVLGITDEDAYAFIHQQGESNSVSAIIQSLNNKEDILVKLSQSPYLLIKSIGVLFNYTTHDFSGVIATMQDNNPHDIVSALRSAVSDIDWRLYPCQSSTRYGYVMFCDCSGKPAVAFEWVLKPESEYLYELFSTLINQVEEPTSDVPADSTPPVSEPPVSEPPVSPLLGATLPSDTTYSPLPRSTLALVGSTGSLLFILLLIYVFTLYSGQALKPITN